MFQIELVVNETWFGFRVAGGRLVLLLLAPMATLKEYDVCFDVRSLIPNMVMSLKFDCVQLRVAVEAVLIDLRYPSCVG